MTDKRCVQKPFSFVDVHKTWSVQHVIGLCFIDHYILIALFSYLFICYNEHILKPKFMLHALCLRGGCCEEIQISNYWMLYIIPIFCEQGGDKFHILLQEIASFEVDYVACFQNCGTVHLEETVNPFTLTGVTPSKLSLVLLILMFILPMYVFALMLNCSAL